MNLPKDFPPAPVGYHYEVTSFNTKFDAIWLVCGRTFTYNDGERSVTIWGFRSKKDGVFHAPINHKKPGKATKLSRCTGYSAMPLLCTPLEAAFLLNQ